MEYNGKMSLVSISDVHIKYSGDPGEKILISFLEHPLTIKSQKIFLLGDIFDLMVGHHEEYFKLFETIWNLVIKRIREGKEVHYFEGNHDFHLDGFFKYLRDRYQLRPEQLQVYNRPKVFEHQGKKYLFCHGDEIEIENPSYKIYRKLIRSKPLFCLSKIVPYSLVHYIGERASERSRGYNQRRFSDEMREKIRDKFRRGSRKAAKNFKVDYIVCGHSHVADIFEDSSFTYINNGFSLYEKQFVLMEDKPILIDLFS
jgi:UDP-2,3-diacylglucosamine hydrolase